VLWGHTYDAAMADLLNLQSQLARGIAAATQVIVTPQEAWVRWPGTNDPGRVGEPEHVRTICQRPAP
jgi:hypothetical protein